MLAEEEKKEKLNFVREIYNQNFGINNRYVDELDSKSKRNFIPLCGTKGQAGTCHNEFDNYGITLLYNPLTISLSCDNSLSNCSGVNTTSLSIHIM